MVTMSDEAVKVLRRLIDEADMAANGLRIMVEPGGCAGLQYLLGLESTSNPGDEVYDFDGIKVYVDCRSLPILDGMRVDFVERAESSGFVFENPNVGKVCSCSRSFAG